ncbi:hypothetical protein LUZ61_019871 [Rhynchospora tenuis]|uniref:Alpha/beta hydrolase fold-3 domain-containing protein n=1 Tax=Rhynchospora tenuis TaxID=198213 RepID=A0AAD6ENA8_9POAL|nr:hypothetical protein LUZ61_019871 [Rhynchospora tenuis]
MDSSDSPSDNTNLFLQIVEHPDGTITRPFVPLSPPNSDPPVLSKDIILNPSHDTYLRLYLPSAAVSENQKLPVVLFFHGGGFVLFSPSAVFYHGFCEAMAASIPALIISSSYRLAPETRLPGAYEDAVEALSWVQSQAMDPASADPWLQRHGDFSKFFLMGSSSGGNIAYHACLRAMSMDLMPVQLCGVILNQPYFGGVERTVSEAASENDSMLPLRANDTLWRLALPIGSNRDHAFANPVKAGLDGVVGMAKCIIIGCKGDPLFDRQKLFAEILEKEGVEVTKRLDGTGSHAIELFIPDKAEALFKEVKAFVYGA